MEALAGLVVLLTLWSPFAWLMCGLWASIAAQSQARSQSGWLLAGLLFGPLALLALASMAPRDDR
jgi:hypothetical protein